jgi:hypothetical protein
MSANTKAVRQCWGTCRVSKRAPCSAYERDTRMSFHCATSDDAEFRPEVVSRRFTSKCLLKCSKHERGF